MLEVYKKNSVWLNLNVSYKLFDNTLKTNKKYYSKNHLIGGPVVGVWDQEVYFSCDLKNESCSS